MTRPLRVLYVLNAPSGGATQGIVELLSCLPQESYEAFLTVPSAPNDSQRARFAELAKAWRVVPVVWWNQKDRLRPDWRVLFWGREMSRSFFHMRPVWQLVSLIRRWQIDLVYTGTALTIEGALAARLCGIPHLWHIKEWIGRRGRVHFWLPDRLLVRTMASLSDQVLVMSRFIGDIFTQNGLEYGRKLTLVRDGVNLSDFEREAHGHLLRQKLGIGVDEIVVGMATSFSSTWKQQDIFIEMAAELVLQFPEACFVAFGSQPTHNPNPIYNQNWRHFQWLKQLVVGAGLQERFIWGGFVDDIPQMMAATDILVHPCAIEPFGRVAIEAMAAGKPVVGPAQGGIAESVVDGRTGFLVEANNPTAFAKATGRLIDDGALRSEMGAEAHRHVAEHFSLTQHVQQIEAIFSSVCVDAAGHSTSMIAQGEDGAR